MTPQIHGVEVIAFIGELFTNVGESLTVLGEAMVEYHNTFAWRRSI